MIRKKQGEMEWLEFELLQGIPSLQHAVFLCHGGVSAGAFKSLNAGGSTGDDPECVEENRKRMMALFPLGQLVSAHQVHGCAVEEVPLSGQLDSPCDGMITRIKHQALMSKHADCQSAIFYDPVEKVLGHVHCGWRGNVQNIYHTTVEKFKSMGSNPANLLVCISPSLGPEHSQFINYQTEFPPHFQEFQWKDFYFNLWEISRMQLQQAGVLPSHIECAEICTYGNPFDFFSFRRDKVTGRNASIAMLC